MDIQLERISCEDQKKIKAQIFDEVIARTTIGLFMWAIAAIIYGFQSYDLIKKEIPELTLWENLWPRLAFNFVPAIMFAIWYKKGKQSNVVKAYSTVIIFPLLLLVGSMIHAWGIFIDGNIQFYLYFHATNIIVIATSLAISSGPPSLFLFQILGYAIFFFGPFLVLFYNKNLDIFKLICNDFIFVSVILSSGLYQIHKIRLELAIINILRKNKISPFIGNNLTKAIYDTKSMEITNYSQDGLIMALDIRGYTKFRQNTDEKIFKAFMVDYNAMATEVIYKNKGYINKTNGDGILASFGVMEQEVDLNDITSLDSELQIAARNRKHELIKKSIITFEQILSEFEKLKLKYKIDSKFYIGGGLDYGSVEVLIAINSSFRKEYDIDSEVIIRAKRLEAHSKELMIMFDPESSFLIINSEHINYPEKIPQLKIAFTNTPDLEIRDYPEIKSIYYRQWKHYRIRDNKVPA